MKKKILGALGVLAITSLALTGCSNNKAEAERWQSEIEKQPGVLEVTKSVSTPLPFTANYSFNIYISPDATNFANLEKTVCDISSVFPKHIDVTITDEKTTDSTSFVLKNFKECETELPNELVAGWEALDNTMVDSRIEVDNYTKTISWGINPYQDYASTSNVADFLEKYAPSFKGYPSIISATAVNTNSTNTTRTTKINVSPSNTEEMLDTSKLLDLIDSFSAPVSEVTVEGSVANVIFNAGTPSTELETTQKLVDELQLSNLKVSVSTDDSQIASAPDGTKELGSKLTAKFYEAGYQIVPGSSGVAVFVPSVAEALIVTDFVENNNPNSVPFRINIENENLYFGGYYMVDSTINDLDPYLLDYQKLAPIKEALYDVKFNKTVGHVVLQPNLSDSSAEYKEALAIMKTFEGNYSELNLYVKGEITKVNP